MSAGNQELDDLMAQLASGDRTSFGRVFELLWGPVLKFCEGVLKNNADAADAAQEAMCKILDRAPDYDKARPAMPWALAIAGWECRTILRKHTRRRESAEAVDVIASDNPQAQLIATTLTAAATTALGTLSASDQEVLIATYWDEAASVSGATLRKRRERALDRLRKSFRRLYGLD
ncbi:MAG: sigma-70 family RNA polymerase sigma factor [Myxococcales bacterium]|nr:sigma-70 family RNA polymerase sigma factor [Myxococcales bacterium]